MQGQQFPTHQAVEAESGEESVEEPVSWDDHVRWRWVQYAMTLTKRQLLTYNFRT